jgi:hypothetical protein
MMQRKVIEQTMEYDGTQLSSLWAYKQFRLQGDSIIAFRGPCNVRLAEMVDQEDVLDQASIYSEDMVHFIVEHFDMDLEKTIIRQRLLMASVREVLQSMGVTTDLYRDGDDLYLGERKASVSIATLSPVSSVIHAGINVSSKNTPVPTIGLADLSVDPAEFAQRVTERYQDEVVSIRMARCKVRGVL